MHRWNDRIAATSGAIAVAALMTVTTGAAQKAGTNGTSKLTFQVMFPASAHAGPITGRVFIMISRVNEREPRLQIGRTGVPFFGRDVEQLKPGEPATIDTTDLGSPLETISEIPPGDPESNARMARESLTGQPFVNQSSVYRIKGELPADQAAADYEQTLHTLFPGTTTFPGFDLVLLGLGPDGHTASLFPHSPALVERTRWVAPNWVEKFRTHRITLTFPVLNAAAEVLFMVAGEDKAWALKEVLKGHAPVSEIPSRGVVPTSGKVTFLVDRAAAAGLGQSP